MPDSPPIVPAGVDLVRWASLMRRAHAATLGGGHVPEIVRAEIAASWDRSLAHGVRADDVYPPLTLEPAEAHDRWLAHPLARASETIRGVLEPLLRHGEHIAVVSDRDGTLLWGAGHPRVLRLADAIGFAPGRDWSERATGTNAVGTALATGQTMQVFSAEHFRPAVHAWQCSAAPVRDPTTGVVLGVIDVSGEYRVAHPLALALVATAARAVEQELRCALALDDADLAARFAERIARYDGAAAAVSFDGRVVAAAPRRAAWPARIDVTDPSLCTPDGAPAICAPFGGGTLVTAAKTLDDAQVGLGVVRATFLHGPLATVETGRSTHRLSLRHSEIVALLCLNAHGLRARALAEALFGDGTKESGVRVEMHRLRQILGPALLTRPYRLNGFATDLIEAVESGDPRLLNLLPASRVPQIVATRRATPGARR